MAGFLRIAAISGFFALTACTGIEGREPQTYLLGYNAAPPVEDVLTICSGYGCYHTTKVRLTDDDISRLQRIMEPGTASAQAEREAVRGAVAWLETRIGNATGLSADRDYRDMMSGGDANQADCIDEAANTTSYLLLLQGHDLLRHHTVRFPTSKGFLLNGVYPHATALIKENKDGRIWAVDSWIYANGEPPVVLPETVWRKSSTKQIMTRYGHRTIAGG